MTRSNGEFLILTVCRISHWVRLRIVVHTVYKLRANRGTVVFNCFNLRRPRRRVCPKNCLTILPTICMMTCVAAADRPHWGDKETGEERWAPAQRCLSDTQWQPWYYWGKPWRNPSVPCEMSTGRLRLSVTGQMTLVWLEKNAPNTILNSSSRHQQASWILTSAILFVFKVTRLVLELNY